MHAEQHIMMTAVNELTASNGK